MDCNPPFMTTYKALLDSQPLDHTTRPWPSTDEQHYCDLPVIDLSRLNGDELTVGQCKKDMAAAASEWGFFQVENHGISDGLLAKFREEQVSIFHQPFDQKTANAKLLGFSGESYRWGNPTATTLKQLSWSEAYHFPLTSTFETPKNGSRHVIEEFSVEMSQLACELVNALAEGLGYCDGKYINQNCTYDTCYLRLNRYPPCPVSARVFGLVPHTDSDFLTIVRQLDQVTGLQLMKDDRWFTVKYKPNTLIINIGDLFQVLSNGKYKSVVHRVISHPHLERFSVAYFVCPSIDTVIQTTTEPAIYKKFSFGEYREQVQEDVRSLGHKVGLTRFLA